MIRPKAIEMKPRSAPENGAFEPLSSNRIAGTEPAPMKTSSAVPMNSANRRCEKWYSAIALTSSRPKAEEPRAVPRGVPRLRCLGTTFDMIEHRSATIEQSGCLCQEVEHPVLERARACPPRPVQTERIRLPG